MFVICTGVNVSSLKIHFCTCACVIMSCVHAWIRQLQCALTNKTVAVAKSVKAAQFLVCMGLQSSLQVCTFDHACVGMEVMAGICIQVANLS
jgi:hypothetical protein